MKTSSFIIVCLVGWYCTAASTGLYAAPNPFSVRPFSERLQLIEEMLDNNLGYTEEVHFNDVLQQETRIVAHYRHTGDYERMFQMQELVIYVLSSRSQVLEALDKCKQMRQEATALNHPIGLLLADFSEGVILSQAKMHNEAQHLFEEVKSQLEAMNEPQLRLTELVYLQLIPLYLRTHQMEKARTALQQMKAFYHHPDKQLNHFLPYCYEAYFHIYRNETQEAFQCLQQAQAAYHEKPEPYYRFFLLHAEAGYAQLIHDYDRAAATYLLLSQLADKERMTTNNLPYRLALVKHYTQQGEYEKACAMLERIQAKRDSLSSRNYTSQINLLRAIYQIDTLDTENRTRRHHLMVGLVAGSLFTLACALTFIFLYHRSNRKLKASRLRLEETRTRAENSIRTKSLFLSNMSHEIRTPLNALSGFSAILGESFVDNETRRQCSDIICQNSELLQKLISDIVDLSSIELGRMEFHMEPCDAVALCRNVVDTVDRIKQTAAEVRFDCAFSNLPLHTDKGRLQQVLINLLVNATKFTTEGSITLTLERNGADELLFSVTDTGCGIPPEQHDAIFNRFEKLNENAQGSGLGLSICRSIIERTGGRIWIDSHYTGGTRFCFTHPIHPDTGKEETV